MEQIGAKLLGDNFMKLILSLLLTIQPAFAQTSRLVVGKVDIQENSLAPRNHIINPNCNENVLSITASGGTVTRGTGAANVESDVMNGRTECRVDASASGQTYTWLTRDLSAGLLGNNCEVRFKYFGLGNGNYKAYAQNEDGAKSAEISLQDYGTYASPTQVLTLPCGNANGYGGANEDYAPRLIIESTNASAPQIYVGDIYSGEVTSIGQFAAPTLYMGGMENAGASSCTYSENTSSGFSNPVALGTGTSCAAWTVANNASQYGTISAQGTNDHRLVYNNMTAGVYKFELAGYFSKLDTTSGNCQFSLFDGTTTYQPQNIGHSSGTLNTNLLIFTVPYTTAGTRTFTVRAADDYTGSCGIFNASDRPFSWKIYRFPAANEPTSAAAANQTDYGWTAYTPTFTGFGTVTVSSCWHSRVSQNLLLQCNFTAGTPTAVEARLSLPNNLVIDPTVIPALATVGRGARNVSNAESQVILAEPSVSYVTFGVGASGVTALGKQLGNVVLAAGNVYSFTAVVPIQGWAQNQRAPTLIGSVTSNSTGAERIERARINCANSGSSIISQSGGISSVSNGGAVGACTVNFSPAFNGVEPHCSVQLLNASISTFSGTNITSATTSTVSIQRFTNASNNNGEVYIICMGPR